MRIKVKPSGAATHTLHIMFRNGKQRTYHVYSDNTALRTIAVWTKSGNPVPKLILHRITDIIGDSRMKYVTGLQYLLLSDKLWEFRHSKGQAALRTAEIAEISVEVGLVDPTDNPLNGADYYDNPLN